MVDSVEELRLRVLSQDLSLRYCFVRVSDLHRRLDHLLSLRNVNGRLRELHRINDMLRVLSNDLSVYDKPFGDFGRRIVK